MPRPKMTFNSEFDFTTGEFFAWSRRHLCIVKTRPFDVRTYGEAAGRSAPQISVVRGGFGQLLRFAEDVSRYRKSRDPFGHDGVVFHWTPETTEDRQLWCTAASIEAFLDAIGRDRVRNVAQFAAASHLHLFMLWLIDRVPEVERMLRENPALFFGLSVRANTLDTCEAVELARWAVGQRHATICQRLGLCSHRILSRIFSPHLRPRNLFSFCKQVIQHKEIRRVASHLKLIPRQTMTIMAAGLPAFRAVRNRVFAELAESPNFDDYPRAGDDLLALRRITKAIGPPPVKLPIVQSLKHLQELRRRLSLASYPRGRRRIAEFLAAEFPETPFESRWLRRIRTIRELRRVGLLLGNCLAEGVLDSECLAGESAFFWCEPTLFDHYPVIVQVARNPATPDEWRFVTAEGPRHQPVSEEHMDFLKCEVERMMDSQPLSASVQHADWV